MRMRQESRNSKQLTRGQIFYLTPNCAEGDASPSSPFVVQDIETGPPAGPVGQNGATAARVSRGHKSKGAAVGDSALRLRTSRSRPSQASHQAKDADRNPEHLDEQRRPVY